jgi:hypothetical protein
MTSAAQPGRHRDIEARARSKDSAACASRVSKVGPLATAAASSSLPSRSAVGKAITVVPRQRFDPTSHLDRNTAFISCARQPGQRPADHALGRGHEPAQPERPVPPTAPAVFTDCPLPIQPSRRTVATRSWSRSSPRPEQPVRWRTGRPPLLGQQRLAGLRGHRLNLTGTAWRPSPCQVHNRRNPRN